MRILIISDSHSDTENFDLLLKMEEPFDLAIHCGDGHFDLDYIEERLKCDLLSVQGNCDLLSRAPRSITPSILGHKIYVEHGLGLSHKEPYELVRFAQNNGFEILMYGHTHRQRIEQIEDIWVINPGSISKPRDGFPSYIVMTIDDNGGISFEGKRV